MAGHFKPLEVFIEKYGNRFYSETIEALGEARRNADNICEIKCKCHNCGEIIWRPITRLKTRVSHRCVHKTAYKRDVTHTPNPLTLAPSQIQSAIWTMRAVGQRIRNAEKQKATKKAHSQSTYVTLLSNYPRGDSADK